jgi:type VII secretion ATPase EccA
MKNLSENLPDQFLVAHLFGQFDDNRKKQYLVLLYRFASITAKADNEVTEEEAKWLSSILQLQSNGCNTRITEEEDDEEDSSESISVKRPTTHSSRAKTELDGLIGLESVKRDVEALTNYIRIQKTREEKGLMTSPISYHCVFTGNPGTGKTTVARILAKIYKNLGVVSKGHLVETDRSGLVAEYVGQTAVKTNKIIDSALDGVLFIDEAYSLIAGAENDYGKEAIATLLKRMEDDRNRLVVILAGYTKEMKDFIDSNPGLQSRFNRYIEFPDYNADELYQIFCKQIKKFQYTMSDEAAEALKSYLAYEVAHKDQNFGNGRFVRNLFERTLQQQANRLSREVNLTTEKLSEITKEDIPIAL